jgi:hypothetical protein
LIMRIGNLKKPITNSLAEMIHRKKRKGRNHLNE